MLLGKSMGLGNRMTWLGRSATLGSKICISTDPRNSHRTHYDDNNPILNTYENHFSGVDQLNTDPGNYSGQIVINTYGSIQSGNIDQFNTHKDDYGTNMEQNTFDGKYEGYIQINTYESNYYGNDEKNMKRDIRYGNVQMSTYQGGRNDNQNSNRNNTIVKTSYGGNYGGERQNNASGGNKDGKESKVLSNLVPVCVACTCNPSAPTKYDSRKFKWNLPKNDVALNFEGIPYVPSGVFRYTAGECLGRNNAAKGSCYQNPEYFSFHHMTFYDMHLVMRPMRRLCPKTGRKP